LYEAVDIFGRNTSVALAGLSAIYGLPMGTWCVSEIQDFSDLFSSVRNRDLASFNEDVSAWDTSKVTTMKEMFRGAIAFDQALASWDTSKVTTMSNMFAGFCSDRSSWSFNQDLSSWKTSSVEDFSYMFRTATNFNRDISAWDVSKASTMEGMFIGAMSFNQSLCLWGEKINATIADVRFMFPGTACPTKDTTNLTANPPGPFCYPCA
jgi:surface protein